MKETTMKRYLLNLWLALLNKPTVPPAAPPTGPSTKDGPGPFRPN